MTQFINPYSSRQYTNASGIPYTGAKLFIYTAGTSTKYTTTKDQAGTSNHTNPIILNSRGEPADGSGAAQAIWQTGGDKVKLVLAPSTDTDPPVSAISTWDNLQGVNDSSITQDQWVSGPAPTYVGATSFTLIGDKTSDFNVGRRLRSTNTAGTIYSTILTSVYTTLTTVTVRNDSGTLDSGLSAVSYGLLSATNNSIPGGDRKGLNLYSQGIGPSYLQNIGIAASVASKALTLSLATKAAAAFSTSDRGHIEHRDPDIVQGKTITREATTDINMVVPSTATLGYAANETAYIYIYSIWSTAGGLEAACIKKAIISEAELQSTTAISTGADSDNVLYSTTARTGATIRLIGRIKIQTGAVAGEWDNQPTERTVWTPSMKASGDTIEYVSATGTSASTLLSTATFTGVNVEVGDRMTINYRVNGTRNAADFAYRVELGLLTGTANLIHDATSSVAILVFLGPATNQPQLSGTFTFYCTVAGTVTSVGGIAANLVGTAALSLSSSVRAEIQRRQR